MYILCTMEHSGPVGLEAGMGEVTEGEEGEEEEEE
jgi:hypothetical protein